MWSTLTVYIYLRISSIMNGNKPKNDSTGKHNLDGSIFDLFLDINPKTREKNSHLFKVFLTFGVSVFMNLTMLQHLSLKKLLRIT